MYAHSGERENPLVDSRRTPVTDLGDRRDAKWEAARVEREIRARSAAFFSESKKVSNRRRPECAIFIPARAKWITKVG